MAAAQNDLSWTKALASPESAARAEAALDVELSKLTRHALTPLKVGHPEYDIASRTATPGRFILSDKRSGECKVRGVLRGDLMDKEALDGPGFIYYTEASQAKSVRALIFRGKRGPDCVTGTADIVLIKSVTKRKRCRDVAIPPHPTSQTHPCVEFKMSRRPQPDHQSREVRRSKASA